MFKALLIEYLTISERPGSNCDIYYNRHRLNHSIEEWADLVMKNEIDIGRAFEWARFRVYCGERITLEFATDMKAFIQTWASSGKDVAFYLHPEMKEFNLDFSVEEFL